MKRETSHTFRNGLADPLPAAPGPWLLGALRQLRLPAVFAALALAALCLAFVDVVSGAVLQGEARKQLQLSQADTTWRCNAQRDAPRDAQSRAPREQPLKTDCRAEPISATNLRQEPLQDSDLATAGKVRLVAARSVDSAVVGGGASDGRALNLIRP